MTGDTIIGANSRIRSVVGCRFWFGAPNGRQTVSFRTNSTEWQGSTASVLDLRALRSNSYYSFHDLSALPSNLGVVPISTALAIRGVLSVTA